MVKVTNLKQMRYIINQFETDTVYASIDFVDISNMTKINAYLERFVDECLFATLTILFVQNI